MDDAAFTVTGVNPAHNDLLGLWRPAPGAEMVSFGAGGGPEPVVWRVALPAGTVEARARLEVRATDANETLRAIAQAGAALQTADMTQTEGAIAFSTTAREKEPSPAEAQLFANMRLLQSGGTNPADSETVSFGTGFAGLPAPDDLEALTQDFRSFVSTSLDLLRPTLRVETRQGRALTGLSLVAIDGDSSHCWPAGLDRDAMGLHRDSVNLSLQTRLALAQLIAQVGAGAAALAFRFNLPGGGVMALPAAYKYLRDVIDQVRQANALVKQRSNLQVAPR